MAKEGKTGSRGLDGLGSAVAQAAHGVAADASNGLARGLAVDAALGGPSAPPKTALAKSALPLPTQRGLPPVHLWNPPFCGDLDMRIGADGTWYYLKTPIGRPALVKLFASVLKREANRYFLVTPVEKCVLTVDDAPFMAVEMQSEGSDGGRVLNFRTNVDDW